MSFRRLGSLVRPSHLTLLSTLSTAAAIVATAPAAHAQMREQVRAQIYPVSNGADAPPAWAATLDHDRPPADTAPSEPAAPRFGAQGEVVVTGSTSLDLSSETFSNSQASQLSASFSPGFDYFVLPNFSIGLAGEISYLDQKGYDSVGNLNEGKTTSVSVAPRLGYNVPLGDYVSWYPRVAFGLVSTHATEQVVTPAPGTPAIADTSATTTGAWTNVFAPILFHPAHHFFLGIGPGIEHTFADQTHVSGMFGEPTEFYGELVIGGWWGGTAPESEGSAPIAHEPTHVRRFGEGAEWVFTGETAISASSTHYSTRGSSSSVMVAPGFDYFVVDNVSVGANAYGEYDTATYGLAATTSTTTYGIAAHVGVNVPLGPLFSLYPRGYLGFGGESDDVTPLTTGPGAAANTSQTTHSTSWVALYVPLLVHPAPHLFVGFGPNVKHELSSDYTSASGQSSSNPGTVLSADLIVGGWL